MTSIHMSGIIIFTLIKSNIMKIVLRQFYIAGDIDKF